VKAFNTLFAPSLEPSVRHEPPLVIFLSGDDHAAKDTVAGLVRDAGFEPFDLGGQDRAWLQEWHGPLYTKQYALAEAREVVAGLANTEPPR
jgi:predicted dinucleotide-binding enzyme